MNAENFLTRYGAKKRIVEEYIDSLNDIKARAYNCPSVGYGEYRRGNLLSDRTGAFVVKIARQETFVKDQVKELEQIRQQTEYFIDQIENDKLRMILKLRYIEGHSIPEISTEISMNTRHCYRLHQKAVQAIDAILVNNSIAS